MGDLSRSEILSRVTTIMRRDLKLGDDISIDVQTPFFGGDADIDSLDLLLLLTSIEREFGIRIPSEEVGRKVFENLGTLIDYLQQQIAKKSEADGSGAGATATGGGDPLTRLPHQPPFRFVTRISNLQAGIEAQGVWAVNGSEDFFRGHFPGQPIVPGVLVSEALAQLSGIAKSIRGCDGRLARVDVRFEQSVVPPAEIVLHSRVSRVMGNLIHYDVEATCKDQPVARGTITLSWLPPVPKSASAVGAASGTAQKGA